MANSKPGVRERPDDRSHSSTEQALRLAEERLSLALAAGDLGTWDWAVSRDELDWSPAAKTMFGLEPGTIVTLERFVGLVYPDDRARVKNAIERALDSGRDYDVRFRVVWPDASLHWLHARGRPQPNPRGHCERMTGIIQDVTREVERESSHRLLEERLLQAEKMQALATFAAGVAHDFNNLLSAILGNVVLARRAEIPAGTASDCIAQIGVAASRAREMLDSLRDFGCAQRPTSAVDLIALLRETIALAAASLPARVGLALETSLDTLFVRGDSLQLERVFMNLLANAGHAVGAEGSIRVATGQEPADDTGSSAHAVVDIIDDGAGMSDEVRHRLFEPFFTTRRASGGTGLGLSVVHGIILAHGGTIEVDSEPGRGTRFRILLPLLPDGEARASPEGGVAPPHLSSAATFSVMYVDDDEVLSLIVKRTLESSGFRAICVADPALALQLLDDPGIQLDVLATDFQMPGMDGLTLASRARSLRPGLPVILCTGSADAEVVRGARDVGVRQVVTKDRIIDALGAWLLEG